MKPQHRKIQMMVTNLENDFPKHCNLADTNFLFFPFFPPYFQEKRKIPLLIHKERKPLLVKQMSLCGSDYTKIQSLNFSHVDHTFRKKEKKAGKQKPSMCKLFIRTSRIFILKVFFELSFMLINVVRLDFFFLFLIFCKYDPNEQMITGII